MRKWSKVMCAVSGGCFKLIKVLMCRVEGSAWSKAKGSRRPPEKPKVAAIAVRTAFVVAMLVDGEKR